MLLCQVYVLQASWWKDWCVLWLIVRYKVSMLVHEVPGCEWSYIYVPDWVNVWPFQVYRLQAVI